MMFSVFFDLLQAVLSANLIPDSDEDFTYGSGQNYFKRSSTWLMNISEITFSIRNEFLALVMMLVIQLSTLSHLYIEMEIVFLDWRTGFSSLGPFE